MCAYFSVWCVCVECAYERTLAPVSNHALINDEGNYGMLRTWLDGVQKAGVKNYLVVAIDEKIAATMKRLGVPHWHREPKALADNSRDNHGISAQKFHMLREFLVLGYSVLLSDVDIVTLADPFRHLYRDVDVEGLSDGFDEKTAYGWNDGIDDPSMGWARYAQTMRIFVMNSGLFYMRPSHRTVSLMDKITSRLERNKEWDQAVYNEAGVEWNRTRTTHQQTRPRPGSPSLSSLYSHTQSYLLILYLMCTV